MEVFSGIGALSFALRAARLRGLSFDKTYHPRAMDFLSPAGFAK